MRKRLRKLWSNRIFQNYFLFLLLFILLEVLFRVIDGMPVFSVEGIRIFLGLNIISLFLGYILSFLPRIVNKIIVLLLVLIASIYGIAELGFHNFLGVYASVGTNTQLGAVTSYIGEFLSSFKWTFYLLIIPFVLLFIYYLFIDKKVTLGLS